MRRLLCTALLSLWPLMPAADPLEGAISLEIVPGWRVDDETHRFAMRFVLGEGWKTYWRAPGDMGIPPAFSWRGSENVDGVSFHWTVPEIQRQNGTRVLGYEGQMVLPMDLRVTDSSRDAEVKGAVQIGICRDICVPITLPFSAKLPKDGGKSGVILGAMLAQPLTAREAGASEVICSFSPIEDGVEITASFKVPALGEDEMGVIEASDPELWVSEADYSRIGSSVTLQADILHQDGGPIALDRRNLRFTLVAEGTAVDLRGCRINA
ncbi:MAG: protein-disulfide reductase DsbD domain-containing protein [Pseudomonadota bacterium]